MQCGDMISSSLLPVAVLLTMKVYPRPTMKCRVKKGRSLHPSSALPHDGQKSRQRGQSQ